MRQATTAFLLLALLAPVFPFPVKAEEQSVLETETVSEDSSDQESLVEESEPESIGDETEGPEEDTLPETQVESEPAPVEALADEAADIELTDVLFKGIGQTVGDAVSDHMQSGEWYLGQTGINFTSPGFVHYIVVFPDIDDPDFIDCRDTVYAGETLNIWLGRGTTPLDAMTYRFVPSSRDPREDGSCVYENDEGVFVYPGTPYQFILNNGYGPTAAFDYLGSSDTVDATHGKARISNSNAGALQLIWKQDSGSVTSLKYLISIGDEPPPKFGVPLDSDYIFHNVEITLAELASHPVLAEHRVETPLGYGYPFSAAALNAPSYFVQDGTVGYVRAKLSSYYERANTSLYFRLANRDCTTPEKPLFEWGIYDGGRNVFGNEVLVGPFSGTECDFTAIDSSNVPGSVLYIDAIASGNSFGLGGGDRDGLVDVTIYAKDSTDPCANTVCASNVLFLPGIKGSRLYIEEDGNDRKLWEPDGNNDVPELFLDENGHSVRDDVYIKPGGIIDDVAFNLMNIYDEFIEDMDSLQANGTINDWEAVPYDWRLSLPDIVNNGVERDGRVFFDEASSTPYIEQTLKQLAASSKTGKVTIVAHSNGGLVTKALLMKLGDAETARLVDKIVFVGVPQSGAPQALGALLYGQREQLPSQTWLPSLILNQETARAFAENSPMGYHLLPSQAYFDAVREDYDHPVARFISGYTEETSAYDSVIGTFDELARYLRAEDGGRTKPSVSDLHTANVLRSNLIDYAKQTHDAIDVWVPPSAVKLYQIAGWGVDTISGVEFYEECSSSGCKEQYRPLFTEDGDGVVPVPSAQLSKNSENTSSYWLDIEEEDSFLTPRKDHGTLFNIFELRAFIKNIATTEVAILPDYVYTTKPDTLDETRKLRYILHSPLSIELIDSNGSRTGLAEDGSYRSEIEDSTYGEFGDVKYVTVPESGNFMLKLSGTGTGTFSLDSQKVVGGYVVTQSTISNVPVTPNSEAYLTIDSGLNESDSLHIDKEGDGVNDAEIKFVKGATVIYQPSDVRTNMKEGGTGNRSRKTPDTNYLNPSSALEDKIITREQAQPSGYVLGLETESSSEFETKAYEASENASQERSTSSIPYGSRGIQDFLYNFFKWLIETFTAFFR